MQFILLATDYDGTIAHDGIVGPKTVSALEALRASGRKLVLVTGRHLPDLRKIFPKLDLFDRVIVENGGVVYQPGTGEEKLLCEPPNQGLIAELTKRNIPFVAGRTIIATWRPHESAVQAAIRDLGLDLQVIFNKKSIMVLPSGVDKGTALQAVLEELGIACQNVVGVGDAENDLPLLRMSGCGVAVANAVPSLKENADIVLEKRNGEGVTDLIDQMIGDNLADLDDNLKHHSISLEDPQDEESDTGLKCDAIMRR
jgi:phosphoglycolate phosphatase (TIGR01487 family)